MSHFDFSTPSGVWAPEMVPGAGHYQRWDVTQSKLLNGDLGGSYLPTAPIVIGGAGVQFTSPSTTIQSGVRTQTGGRIILGQYDLPALNARTRTIMYGLGTVKPSAFTNTPNTALLPLTSPSGKSYTASPDTYFQVLQPPVSGVLVSNVAVIQIPIPSEYLHNGGYFGIPNGQLSSITLNFRVPQQPGMFTSSALGSPFLRFLNGANAPPPFGFPELYPINFASAGGGLWQPSTAYANGYYVLPLFKAPPPLVCYYRCIGSGTSAGAEPNWPTVPGTTFADGGVTWLCIGSTGVLQYLGGTYNKLSPAGFWNSGAPQSYSINFDSFFPQPLSTTANRYTIQIVPPLDTSAGFPGTPVPMILHSLQFTFRDIVSMAWA